MSAARQQVGLRDRACGRPWPTSSTTATATATSRRSSRWRRRPRGTRSARWRRCSRAGCSGRPSCPGCPSRWWPWPSLRPGQGLRRVPPLPEEGEPARGAPADAARPTRRGPAPRGLAEGCYGAVPRHHAPPQVDDHPPGRAVLRRAEAEPVARPRGHAGAAGAQAPAPGPPRVPPRGLLPRGHGRPGPQARGRRDPRRPAEAAAPGEDARCGRTCTSTCSRTTTTSGGS